VVVAPPLLSILELDLVARVVGPFILNPTRASCGYVKVNIWHCGGNFVLNSLELYGVEVHVPLHVVI